MSRRRRSVALERAIEVAVKPEIAFKALADETRQRLLALLHRHELAVSELVDVLGQPQSTVSRHLKVLREAGLIHDRREGNHVLCAVLRSAGSAGGGLRDLLLSWAGGQPLSAELRDRLLGVLERRKEMSRQFFDRVGRHWDKLREEAFGSSFHLEALVALLPADWVVADVGTGTGYALPVLAARFRQVIGIEPVERMREAAESRIAALDLRNVALRAGDLAHLPLEDGEVDLAQAVLVLHHTPEPAAALAELHRVLRPAGRLLIVEQVEHEHEGFRERMQDRWRGFDPAALSAQLASAGFADVQAHQLTTVQPAADAPGLYAITAARE